MPVAPVDTNQAPVDTNKPVEDTPEVVAARNAHLAEVEKAKSQAASEPENESDSESVEVKSAEVPTEIAPLVAPEPVDYTPEVKEAREKHFQAVETAKKIQELTHETEQIETVQPVTVNIAHPHPILLKSAPLKSFAYHAAHTYPIYSHYPYTVQIL